MNAKEKFEIIKKNTVEIITEDELKNLISKKKKPSMYIGAAPTGKMHAGYFPQAVKLKDFIKAGFEVKYFLADIHAYLDDRKAPWELTKAKARYYKEAMTAILKSIGADYRKVEFVLGSDVQRSKEYIMDLYKLMGRIKEKRARRASSEVVRQVENPDVGSYVYPLMQAIDPHHLKADVALSGIDQRKIYMLAREEVGSLGYAKPICVFTDLIPGLKKGVKMSASVPGSAITLEASEKEIKNNLRGAYCPEGIVEDNGVLALAKYVIFPTNEKLKIERPEKFGGNKIYETYAKLEADYKAKKLHPMDLKNAVAKELNKYIDTIRKHFKTRQKIVKDAYP